MRERRSRPCCLRFRISREQGLHTERVIISVRRRLRRCFCRCGRRTCPCGITAARKYCTPKRKRGRKRRIRQEPAMVYRRRRAPEQQKPRPFKAKKRGAMLKMKATPNIPCRITKRCALRSCSVNLKIRRSRYARQSRSCI